MKTAKPGDWVRFQRNDALVIGVVAYIRPRASWQHNDTVITDAGEVSADRVLEVRTGHEQQETQA